ncbi:hypothetical protein M153_12547000127, partial [Pseudoloma neurophilia]
MDRINRFLRLRPGKKQKSFVFKNKIYTFSQKEIQEMRAIKNNKCSAISLDTKIFYKNDDQQKELLRNVKMRKTSKCVKRISYNRTKNDHNRTKNDHNRIKNDPNRTKTDFIRKGRNLSLLTENIWQDTALQPKEFKIKSIGNNLFNEKDLSNILLSRDNKYLECKKKIKIQNILDDQNKLKEYDSQYKMETIKKYKNVFVDHIDNNIAIKYGTEPSDKDDINKKDILTDDINKKDILT